jgi:hypothetical protein
MTTAPSRGTAEHARLAEAPGWAEDSLSAANPWDEWGPYLSERAWGTVREDYSDNGDAWSFFPHDHARSRAYRWSGDNGAGIGAMHQTGWTALVVDLLLDPPRRGHRMIFYDETTAEVSTIAAGPAG